MILSLIIGRKTHFKLFLKSRLTNTLVVFILLLSLPTIGVSQDVTDAEKVKIKHTRPLKSEIIFCDSGSLKKMIVNFEEFVLFFRIYKDSTFSFSSVQHILLSDVKRYIRKQSVANKFELACERFSYEFLLEPCWKIPKRSNLIKVFVSFVYDNEMDAFSVTIVEMTKRKYKEIYKTTFSMNNI